MTPWVLRIIIANVVMYLLTLANPLIVHMFKLVPGLVVVRPWTLLTYMFLHAGIGHLLFNMLALFFFGPRLEIELGTRRFLILYGISGLVGALLSFFLVPYASVVGASGAIYGVLMGFAYYWPKEKLYVWGVLPVEARWMVVGMTLLSVFGGFGDSSSGVAHFAHLGGFLGGYLYLRWISPRRDRPASKPSVADGPSGSDLKRWNSIDREALHPVNREEFDRIREKMGALSPGSLTGEEKAFLDRFSMK